MLIGKILKAKIEEKYIGDHMPKEEGLDNNDLF
jgi:hypothetical protein